MTVVFGLGTGLLVRMHITFENGVLRNGQQPSLSQDPSLVPTPRVPPGGEKRSGEQSRISWAYSPKQWKTNEIARSLIIT